MNKEAKYKKLEEYTINNKDYSVFFSNSDSKVYIFTSKVTASHYYSSINTLDSKYADLLKEELLETYNWHDLQLINIILETLDKKGYNQLLLRILDETNAISNERKLDIFHKILKFTEDFDSRISVISLILRIKFDSSLYDELLLLEKNKNISQVSKLLIETHKLRENEDNTISSKTDYHLESIKPNKEVFISYTGEIKNWVERLASELSKNNIHVYFDVWDVKFGERFTEFMNKIEKVHYTLMIFTEKYIEKLKSDKGGVSYERKIIDALIVRGLDHQVIPIIKEEKSKNLIPTRFSTKRYCDLSTKENFDMNIGELINQIRGIRKRNHI